MKVADRLQEILEARREPALAPEIADLFRTSELVRAATVLQGLRSSRVSDIANTLTEKIPEMELGRLGDVAVGISRVLRESSLEGRLPAVGETVGVMRDDYLKLYDVVVTKVERRTDRRDRMFWVVGIDFGGRYTYQKSVRELAGGLFEVSWKQGARWRRATTTPSGLQRELAREMRR